MKWLAFFLEISVFDTCCVACDFRAYLPRSKPSPTVLSGICLFPPLASSHSIPLRVSEEASYSSTAGQARTTCYLLFGEVHLEILGDF